MYKAHKSIIHNTLLLKLLSLVFGYCLWHFISQSHIMTRTYSVPLFFYNTTEHTKINGPDEITVHLRSTKATLALIGPALAAHIDAHTLHEGSNCLHISPETLFLPKNIELTHVTPAPVMVALENI
jgi:hypothetical protein